MIKTNVLKKCASDLKCSRRKRKRITLLKTTKALLKAHKTHPKASKAEAYYFFFF